MWLILVNVVALCLDVTSQESVNPLEVEKDGHNQYHQQALQAMHRNIDRVELENTELRSQHDKLLSVITNTRKQCTYDMEQLNNTLFHSNTRASANQRQLIDTLQKIHEIESKYNKSVDQAEILSEVMDLLGVQYQIVSENMNILERRRESNVYNQCHEISSVVSMEDNYKVYMRSSYLIMKQIKRRESRSQNVQLRLQQKKLNNKLYERDNLLSALKEVKGKLKAVVEVCNTKKSNLQILTSKSKKAFKTSIGSISVLENNLKHLTSLYQQMENKIKHAKGAIDKFRNRLNIIKKRLISFSTDLECYTKLINYD